MSEQYSLNFGTPEEQRTPEHTDINELKDSYREKIGVPYPITGESNKEIRARIEQLLTMSDEDARAAVRQWEREQDTDLNWQQK
jgi:2-oxo-4-hydroxy-4-carboxy--5-ureidoimidazoline (OHCU) decarboxylase